MAGLAGVVGLFAALATLLCTIEGAHWLLDLLVHFRPYYALALALSGAVLLLQKRRRLALASGILLALNAIELAPFYGSAGNPAVAAMAAPPLKVAWLNVQAENRAYDAVLEWIRLSDADIVALIETDPAWLNAIAPLASRYPFRLAEAGAGHFGMTLLSRLALRDTSVFYDPVANVPELAATFDHGGQATRITAVHPPPPISAALTQYRNQYLHDLGRRLAAAPGAQLVVGDFNITPWSATLKALLATAGLSNCALGHGLSPTWPTLIPLARIPIDLCLQRGFSAVSAYSTGPHLGSDHLPVTATLVPAPP